MTIPKPPRRERKPRKRIARTWRQSKQPEGLRQRKRKREEALKLWAEVVRLEQGPYSAMGSGKLGQVSHHIFGKKACPAVQFDPRNGAFISAGEHMWVHLDHERQRDLGIKMLGAEGYEAMKIAAHSGARSDPSSAIVVLAARLAELKGA